MVALFVNVAGRFGINAKEAERFFKFAVVGAIGFVVDFGVSNLLLIPFDNGLQEGRPLHAFVARFTAMPEDQALLFAGTISFICAIISNFIWNRYWTYPDSRSKSFRRQFVQFSVVSIAGIVIRSPILAFAYAPFTTLVANVSALEPYAARIGANLALVLAVIIVMFWNFFVNRYWTYSDVE
ncbi:MAG: GtrA family protein [Chloroflexi bacterium]|nr:GtrA family protein [Chloroflexota bacterium]